jgi:hypothetical protein
MDIFSLFRRIWAARNVPLRLPSRHELAHKGEHFFHSSYLMATAANMHGLPSYFAGAALIFILMGLLVHTEAS